MRGWKQVVVAVVVGSGVASPVSAQSTGWLDRTLDGLGRTIDRVVGNLGDVVDGDAVWSEAAEDFRWTGRLASGDELEIKGINGDIIVEPARGNEVTVTAQARGRRSDPESVRIERVEHANGVTFCAVYPTPERAREENRCAPGSAGRMNTHNNDVEVTFTIQVPAGVSFIGNTVNGEIEAFDLENDLELMTVNGDVELSTTGFAEAETVNGSIDARMGEMDRIGGARFSTVNGSIDLDVPNGIDADVDASWLNGGFDSDIPLRINGRMSRKSAQGVFGDGGPDLELETVNGSIRIR